MQFHFIKSDPGILNGKPVITGSRISVEMILEWLSTGGTVEKIYREYPHLPKGSVEEAILYASHFSKNEILLEDEISS
ncbi:MAG: DUF433 domain-containing protein [Ginsengibacter sp.]|jgi:uncharacterized protein (DUF433 family)